MKKKKSKKEEIKENNTKTIIAILAAIVVVLGLIILTVVLSKKEEETPNDGMPVEINLKDEDISDDKTLDRYDQNDVWLFLAVGKRDEFNPYETEIAPRLPRLKQMKHCYIFTPEWVYNGDKGIASINFGVEMGQHCLINPMHCNLMFDDDTPMYPELPEGILGWLRKVIEE